MMSTRLRSALVLFVGQVVLVLLAHGLCCASTKRSELYAFGSTPYVYEINKWCGSLYLGDPVPWAEYSETRYDLGDPFPVAHNVAVPVCMLLLAICVPPLIAAELEWRRRRTAGVSKCSRSRRVRARWVVVAAAGLGWTVAFLDVVTDPEGTALRGVGHVPFHRAPGSWSLVRSSSPGSTPPTDAPQVEWLRKKRGELLPPEPGSGYDPETIIREWDARTRRTVLGMGIGLACACVLFRPWRGNYPADKLDVDGKSCPSC
jgi:hypothetical protein